MNIDLIQPHELDASLASAWSQIQRTNPALRSPFMRPEFTQICAQVHRDVEIAVLSERGTPVGFFPFHRVGRRMGLPIGKGMSDFQGMIVAPDLVWSLEELMRACRLSSWSFNHLLSSCGTVAPHALTWAESPFLDLEGGFEAYRERKRLTGSKGVEAAERSHRLIARDIGETEFCLHNTDLNELPLMLSWQRENLERQGTWFLDCTSERNALIEALLSHNTPEFAGWFSTLRVGGELLAGTIYLRSYQTCHWWITAYDANHSRYSPGAVALLLAAKAAAEREITRIDLGRGMQELKRRLMSGSDMVGDGIVEFRAFGSLRKAYWQASQMLWKSPIKAAAKNALRHWRALHNTSATIGKERSSK